MSEELKKVNEDLVKSLALELDMSEEEIYSFLKSEEEGDDGDDVDGKKKPVDEEEGDDDAGEGKPGFAKGEAGDLSVMSDDDLKKSISGYLSELKLRQGGKNIEKSANDTLMKSIETNLMKSFSDSLNSIKEEFKNSINEVTGKVNEISKSVEKIGEASQGTKAMSFNFIEKSEGESSFEKDGKTIISSRDRDTISNKLLDLIEKSDDNEFKSSASADLINYQGSGEFSKSMLSTLNKNNIYFREQIK